MLWAFSSKLLFCHSLAVSVNVGGKQYLLGLYDTAGQVQSFLFFLFFQTLAECQTYQGHTLVYTRSLLPVSHTIFVLAPPLLPVRSWDHAPTRLCLLHAHGLHIHARH